METMGVTPTMPLYAGNDNMCGSWFWIILILLFAGRGFGFGGGVETGVQNNFIENVSQRRNERVIQFLIGLPSGKMVTRFATPIRLHRSR